MWEDLIRDKQPAKKNRKLCKRCGLAFEYSGIGKMYCSRCSAIDSAEFSQIKEYLYENGPANAIDIEEATGISKRSVSNYLREGRLEIPENSTDFIRCELCGTKLRSGRYCPDCAHKMSAEKIQSATFDKNEIGEPHNQGKMHYKKKI